MTTRSKRTARSTLLALIALSLPGVALAQLPPNCTELCGVSCVKPIAIPDRWDDVTAIAGYTGGGKSPNWRNNGVWDQESFTDTNGNGIWDPGEPFVDGNGNGIHDAEAYDPLATGYVLSGNPLSPSGDLGLQITLHYGTAGDRPAPGEYLAIDLPPVNKGTPVAGSSAFADNLANCNSALVEPGDQLQLEPSSLIGPANQGMRDLVAQDPDAYWDPITQTVQGSAFSQSPRVIHVPVFDPRIPGVARSQLVVRKVIAFFMEQMTGQAQVIGRLVREQANGTACSGASSGGFFYACATPATRASWGQMKATYR